MTEQLMKIGLVCPYNICKGGGVQECVRAMQVELKRRGHHVLIITPEPRDNQLTKNDGIVFIGGATDIKSPFHTTAQVSATVNTEALNNLLDREQFDVLHFHEPWVPIVSRQILARSAAKNVATFHAKLPETMMSRTIERVITPYTKSIIKQLDGLSAVSEAAAEYIGMLTDQPVTIIPNGIDLANFASLPPKRPQKSIKHILYIGRLERRKGVRYLLRAFAELSRQHPNIKLTIAGEGPDRLKLERLAESLGLDRAKFTGYVSQAAKQRLFAQADILCSPALFGESFGIVLLEAMAAGLPVVAGNNPGYTSVMKGRGALSLVNPKDTPEFARRLGLMLYDEELRSLWRNWARKYVQQFAYEKVVDQYEKLYKKLLN